MKHALLPLFGVMLLAACEPPTPLQQCLSQIRSEAPTLRRLAEETRANVARGYGLSRRTVPVEAERVCETRQPDGSILQQTCFGIDTREITEPVAIDLDAERAKLRSLEAQLERDDARYARAQQACINAYPE